MPVYASKPIDLTKQNLNESSLEILLEDNINVYYKGFSLHVLPKSASDSMSHANRLKVIKNKTNLGTFSFYNNHDYDPDELEKKLIKNNNDKDLSKSDLINLAYFSVICREELIGLMNATAKSDKDYYIDLCEEKAKKLFGPGKDKDSKSDSKNPKTIAEEVWKERNKKK